MKILYAASEATPFIATGGLGRRRGLPAAGDPQQAGTTCRVVVPLYSVDQARTARKRCSSCAAFTSPLGWRNQYCGVVRSATTTASPTTSSTTSTTSSGTRHLRLLRRRRSGSPSSPRPCCEMLAATSTSTPDIIHCNDWQTGTDARLSQPLLPPPGANTRTSRRSSPSTTSSTRANTAWRSSSDVLGHALHADAHHDLRRMRQHDEGRPSRCADHVTTVSPTYAQEITDPWFAHGLDRLLRASAVQADAAF